MYGPEDTGDITDPAVADAVRASLDGALLHLVTCDGGFDVTGSENEQETLHLPLIAAELALGLETLAEEGTLVCKMFTTHSPCSLQLLYLLGTCFDRITLVKPKTSRPANSERYVVAMGRRPEVGAAAGVMRAAATALAAGASPMLPVEVPEAFVKWLRKVNNTEIRSQTKALAVYHQAAVERRSALDPKMFAQLHSDVLQQWGLVTKKGPKRRKQR